MSEAVAAAFGALVLLGCQCVAASIFCRHLNRDPEWLMRLLGTLLLATSRNAGYECMVIGSGVEATTVRFEDITAALNAGDVFTRVPESSAGACDGQA